MSRECNIELDKWEIADNIDLYYIFQDFEEYFEIKFQRKPVLVKKAVENPMDFRNKKGLPPSTKSRQSVQSSSDNQSKQQRTSSASRSKGAGLPRPSVTSTRYKQISERKVADSVQSSEQGDNFEI